MITSTLTTVDNPQGLIDESTLHKTVGSNETAEESTTWVEYRQTDDGPVIHRSVHMTLKPSIITDALAGSFN